MTQAAKANPSTRKDSRGKSENRDLSRFTKKILRYHHGNMGGLCSRRLRHRPVDANPVSSGWPIGPFCANRPDTPGQMRETPSGTPCRNFRPKRKPPQRDEPPAPTSDDVRHIALIKGKFAIVDAADYEYLSSFRWFAKEARGRFYAATTQKDRIVTMHQLLMDPPPGMVVDHVNGNGLNNRRENMRICTPQQNRRNTKPRRKSSVFLGVSRCGDKYKAQVKHDGHQYYLGLFADETEAAQTRDREAKELFGEFASLNFPEQAAGHVTHET